ncbi:MAG: hypothetical protein ABSG25_13390, partial [Bryobacteraceae bacterium]
MRLYPAPTRRDLHTDGASDGIIAHATKGAARANLCALALAAALPILSATGWAQPTPSPTPPPAAQEPNATGTAAAQAMPEASPTQEEYSGPAILSRGGLPSISRDNELATLKPFVQVSGLYSTGLTNGGVNSQGQLLTSDGEAVQASWGVTGTHLWRTSSLSLDYRGFYDHYTNNQNYNGADNSLMLKWEKKISPRLAITLSEEGALYQHAFALPYGSSQNYGSPIGTLATNSLFNTRTLVSVSTAQIVYQLDSRTSISASISGDVMRPRINGLPNTNGYSAGADIARRISRYQTIGLQYMHSGSFYSDSFGHSGIDGVSAMYSVRLNRRLELSTSAGVDRSNFFRSQTILIDNPVLQQLLGENSIFIAQNHTFYLPHFDARLSYVLKRSQFTLSGRRTILPGNGLYLSPTNYNASAWYSYNASRRLSLGLGGEYTLFIAAAQNIGNYHSWYGGGSTSFRLARSISWTASVNARNYAVGGTALR